MVITEGKLLLEKYIVPDAVHCSIDNYFHGTSGWFKAIHLIQCDVLRVDFASLLAFDNGLFNMAKIA